MNEAKITSETKRSMLRSTCAVILSGGAARRMNNQDKGLQKYRNKPLIEHVLARLRPQVASIVVVANRNLNAYRALHKPIISDQYPFSGKQHCNDHFNGPMAGLCAALHYLKTEQAEVRYALISSCDTPYLPTNFAEKLGAALNGDIAAVTVAHDGQRRQNLHCLIAKSAWSSLIQAYDQGQRAIWRWQDEQNATEVDFSDDIANAGIALFKNLNYLEDLRY